MIKALLLSTLLAWPFTAIAQDAPAPTYLTMEQIVAKICVKPLTPEINNEMGKDFSLVMVYDTALSTEHAFIRSMIFQTKEEREGNRSVIEISIFMKNDEVVTQCISSFGAFNMASVEEMKKQWETSPPLIPTKKNDATPLTPPAAGGSVPAPSFQANPDE